MSLGFHLTLVFVSNGFGGSEIVSAETIDLTISSSPPPSIDHPASFEIVPTHPLSLSASGFSSSISILQSPEFDESSDISKTRTRHTARVGGSLDLPPSPAFFETKIAPSKLTNTDSAIASRQFISNTQTFAFSRRFAVSNSITVSFAIVPTVRHGRSIIGGSHARSRSNPITNSAPINRVSHLLKSPIQPFSNPFNQTSSFSQFATIPPTIVSSPAAQARQSVSVGSIIGVVAAALAVIVLAIIAVWLAVLRRGSKSSSSRDSGDEMKENSTASGTAWGIDPDLDSADMITSYRNGSSDPIWADGASESDLFEDDAGEIGFND
jgi:hypothetical protein